MSQSGKRYFKLLSLILCLISVCSSNIYSASAEDSGLASPIFTGKKKRSAAAQPIPAPLLTPPQQQSYEPQAFDPQALALIQEDQTVSSYIEPASGPLQYNCSVQFLADTWFGKKTNQFNAEMLSFIRGGGQIETITQPLFPLEEKEYKLLRNLVNFAQISNGLFCCADQMLANPTVKETGSLIKLIVLGTAHCVFDFKNSADEDASLAQTLLTTAVNAASTLVHHWSGVSTPSQIIFNSNGLLLNYTKKNGWGKIMVKKNILDTITAQHANAELAISPYSHIKILWADFIQSLDSVLLLVEPDKGTNSNYLDKRIIRTLADV